MVIKKASAEKTGSEKNAIQKFSAGFDSAMADDLNTPEALARIFDFINETNSQIWSLSKNQAKTAKKTIFEKLKILGIAVKTDKIPFKIALLAKKRDLLRNNKQFAKSDSLRKKILELGYKIEDTPLGPLILKNKG